MKMPANSLSCTEAYSVRVRGSSDCANATRPKPPPTPPAWASRLSDSTSSPVDAIVSRNSPRSGLSALEANTRPALTK
jgi:hypothetical protein